MPSVPRQPCCPKCGELKKYAANRWRCRPCDIARSKADNAAWLSRNREKNRLHSLAYAAAHREEAASKSRAWYAANKERAANRNAAHYVETRDEQRAKRRAYYLANREHFLERARNSTWRADNPAGARDVVLRRRAIKAKAICEHGIECVSNDFLAVLYSSLCRYCDSPAQHADHFFPLSKGGLHCRDNLVPACGPCNTSKGASDPYEWIATRN